MSAISCLAEPRLPVLPFHDSTACRQLWSCGTLGRPSILHPAMTGPSIFLQYLGLPKTHVAWTAAKTPALHQGSRGGGRLPRRNRYGAVGLGRLWSPDAIEGRAKRLRSTIGRPQNAHATVGSTAERRRCLLAVIPRRLHRNRRVERVLRNPPDRPGATMGHGLAGSALHQGRKRSRKGVQGRSLGNFARTGATAGQTDLKRLAPLHYRASLAICSRTKRLVEPSGFWDAKHEVQVLNRCA